MNTPRWYAIRTRSRAEKVVQEQITQRGLESFLPLMTRVSLWKDRRKRIEWPLFAGYCFARFTGEQRLLVLQSPGVVEIVGSAVGRAEPIPDDEIITMQRVISSRQVYEPHSHLTEGMAVEVLRGPLLGLRGKLVRKTDGCRLSVAITLIGQGAAVHIDAQDIAPVGSSVLSVPS